MSVAPAISVRNLSKSFRLGERKPYDTLRDQIAGFAGDLFRGRVSMARKRGAVKWHNALHDVTFDVQPGEILGLIGRNGAGKSTLLKILARVTAPTSGEVLLRGHLAPLLEVGTGFNPELTGRENVLVNGTLLGMSRREIDKKFESIVTFAGVEHYVDTPVKRYSTGMVVRLGFAVAAHLDPEILLVDEVLAVGDAAFQKRCLGKMDEISKRGRTVLFVSHNMEAVQGLCSRVIWIDGGGLRMDGSPQQVVREYITAALSESRDEAAWPNAEARQGSGRVRFTHVNVRDEGGNPISVVGVGQSLAIELGFVSSARRAENVSFRIWLQDEQGREPVCFMTTMTGQDLNTAPERGRATCLIPRLTAGPRQYMLKVQAYLGLELGDQVDIAASLDVVAADFFGSGNSMTEGMTFLCDHSWDIAAVA